MSKIKWKEPETWIIIACIIVMVLFMAYVLTGCTPHTKGRDLKIIWYDGKCLMVADGMSIEQAKEIKEYWKFEECKVQVSDIELEE